MLQKTSQSRGEGSPRVTGFYEAYSGSIQYVVIDEATRHAALIDVVQDFDPKNVRTSFASAENIVRYVEAEQLTIDWILDTHPHADHLMASAWLKDRLGAPTAIGEKVREVAALWETFYNQPGAFDVDSAFNRLFADGDTFQIGGLPVRVMLSPGHTLASITYVVGRDAAFVHDTFMQPDFGTSRADFPGGSSRDLYRSLQRILELPDETRLFVGHDYGTKTREEPAWESTVGEQRAENAHIGGGVSEDDYAKLRDTRDATLSLPDRMLYALQVNLRGGRLPAPEADGHSYLRVPVNRF